MLAIELRCCLFENSNNCDSANYNNCDYDNYDNIASQGIPLVFTLSVFRALEL